MEIFLRLNYYIFMNNKHFKLKLTKSTFRLVIVSAIAFLGLCLFGLSDLTNLYGMPGYFYLNDIPHYIFSGIKDSFIINYSYFMAINLVPIGLFLLAAIICVFCFIFRLKPQNLITAILLVVGTAALLCVTSMTFVLVRDKAMIETMKNLALFKNVKTDMMSAIQSIGLWIAAIALVISIPMYLMFIYYAIRDSIYKKPRLKGEAKYLYDNYSKSDIAKVAGGMIESGKYGNTKTPEVVQTVETKNGTSVTVTRPVRVRRPVVNNINVQRGTPLPERSTNVVQFVNCDDTFVEDVKARDEEVKGATFINAQRI